MHRTVSPGSTLIVAVRVWVSAPESVSGKPETSSTQRSEERRVGKGGGFWGTVYSYETTIANVRELLPASENSPRSSVREKAASDLDMFLHVSMTIRPCAASVLV